MRSTWLASENGTNLIVPLQRKSSSRTQSKENHLEAQTPVVCETMCLVADLQSHSVPTSRAPNAGTPAKNYKFPDRQLTVNNNNVHYLSLSLSFLAYLAVESTNGIMKPLKWNLLEAMNSCDSVKSMGKFAHWRVEPKIQALCLKMALSYHQGLGNVLSFTPEIQAPKTKPSIKVARQKPLRGRQIVGVEQGQRSVCTASVGPSPSNICLDCLDHYCGWTKSCTAV